MSTPPSFDPQPCCDGAGDAPCGQPVQFCQNSSTTGPVEHPGRQYDLTLPINQGFAVEQLLVDSTTHNAGITWSVLDSDGAAFAEELRVFLEGRLPAAAVVTITNPNAGEEICGDAEPFQIHIECLRLDEAPPNLIELIYNAGSDKILNAAYRPLNSFTSTARRQDNGGNILCTSVANRGWETNDQLQSFEFWGPANATPVGAVTPTPRGTPVQEINANGSGLPSPNSGSTIWQTFEVTPAENGSTFNLRVVVGGRAGTEAIRVRLFNGDEPNPGTAPGGLIDTTLNAPKVAPPERNPWTNYSNDLPLAAGLYTLAFTGPDTTSIGGLFTDMRAFIDRPGRRATATTDDETCVVTTDETTTNTVCSFWSPVCSNGEISSWMNVETQLTLTNEEFWAQTPSPTCCLPQAAEGGGGGGGQSNMAVSDVICATVGGVPQNAIRTVVLDPSGGQLSEEFLSTNGTRITPADWQPGQCTTLRYLADAVLCDVDPATGNVIVSFLRKYVQTWSEELGARTLESRDFTLDGSQVYTLTGVAQDCEAQHAPFTMTGLCLADGTPIGVVYHRGNNAPIRDGWVNLLTGAYSAGDPPAGAVACASGQSIQTTGVFCVTDDTTGDVLELVLIEYSYGPDGSVDSVRIVRAEDGTTYTVPVGASLDVCPAGTEQPGQQMVQLCNLAGGDSVPFLRDYRRDDTGAITGFTDYTLAGVPFTPAGPIAACRDVDTEIEVLCDVNAGVATPFLRRYSYNAAGLSVGVNSTALDGSAYTPTGTVAVCSGTHVDQEVVCWQTTAGGATIFTGTIRHDDSLTGPATPGWILFDQNTTPVLATEPGLTFVVCQAPVALDEPFGATEEVMCDAGASPEPISFVRRTILDANGLATATQNVAEDGTAYLPVGPVRLGACDECCPIVLSDELCADEGAGVIGATSLRLPDGTVQIVAHTDGHTVDQSDVIACPDPDASTLTAQLRTLTAAQVWTPGADVTGTLTGVTVLVITGAATIVDENGTSSGALPAGTSVSWNAGDPSTLTGPQSVTAGAASTVLVTWTQRA